MQKYFRNFFLNFKEYILVVLLLTISLIILTNNHDPRVRGIKTFALGNFALLNSSVSWITGLFENTSRLSELRKQNAELMLQVNRLREYGLENESLRKMLDFKDSVKLPLQPAQIISKLVSKVQGVFILNAGSSDGIKSGMPVITPNGLVGLVADVSDKFCTVKTIYNSTLKIAVTIQRTNIQGILGWNGNELFIKNIPTTRDIQPGDRVVTSELSTIFPPSIPVGLVTDKESNVLGLLHNVTIKSFADVNSVKNVFILKIVPDKEINNLELNLLKN